MRIRKVGLVLAFTAASLGTSTAGAAADNTCERGEFCLWPTEFYEGTVHRVALETTNPGECVPLPEGLDARSFANRTTRPVTVYQGRDCSTEGEFDTYPAAARSCRRLRISCGVCRSGTTDRGDRVIERSSITRSSGLQSG